MTVSFYSHHLHPLFCGSVCLLGTSLTHWPSEESLCILNQLEANLFVQLSRILDQSIPSLLSFPPSFLPQCDRHILDGNAQQLFHHVCGFFFFKGCHIQMFSVYSPTFFNSKKILS